MKQNGMDVPEMIESKGGIETAELIRHVLKTHGGIDAASKIALLEKTKGEIIEETNLQKKTDLNKTPKGKSKGASAKNKNDILR